MKTDYSNKVDKTYNHQPNEEFLGTNHMEQLPRNVR